ncbi:MAG: helix-turn-helix domain-containing protein [Candidatus Thermoplasmatota archaeon]|nr:helix-turn-helix domain-containing protein [Candidatus Thermoplasmatota archaeon]
MPLVRHISKEQLEMVISREKYRARMIKRLLFIKLLYDGHSLGDACEIMGITKSCGYMWLNRWNLQGPTAFVPVTRPGRPRKVSATSRQIVDLLGRNHSLEAARSAIRERFGVEYSYRQIIRIIKQIEQENLEQME